MNRNKATKLGRLAALLVVTGFAVAVMWASGTRNIDDETTNMIVEAPAPPAAPVAVRELAAEAIELHGVYAGMIRPFERYSIAFEVPGRVLKLGVPVGATRQPRPGRSTHDLDVGDRVEQGQVIAVLDQRVLKARVEETTARLEQAQQELDRARRLRGSGQVISETQLQTRVTELAVAEAQFATAQKNFEDATLRAPCDGVISRRMVNAGESIQQHQPAFEVVQVSQLLLTVGVPESRVQELETRRRQILAAGGSNANFKTHVHLLGRNRYGQPWPDREGFVYQIAATADDRTGLFEVEVLLDNTDGMLKPGQVAQARIVIDELQAYRVPLDAVLFRGDEPYFYAVHTKPSDLQVMFWDAGSAVDYVVHRVPIAGYVEQDGELILPDVAPEDRMIVVRGQHRLVDGRRVRIARSPTEDSPAQEQTTARPDNATVSGATVSESESANAMEGPAS